MWSMEKKCRSAWGSSEWSPGAPLFWPIRDLLRRHVRLQMDRGIVGILVFVCLISGYVNGQVGQDRRLRCLKTSAIP